MVAFLDKFKRKIPPMIQVYYNHDFGFLIVPDAVEKIWGVIFRLNPQKGLCQIVLPMSWEMQLYVQ